jgi:RNA polymerase sigma factor (sigma-70 family)
MFLVSVNRVISSDHGSNRTLFVCRTVNMATPDPSDDHESDRISRISTQWTLLQQAHQSDATDDAIAARSAVVQRYIGPIYRYLQKVMLDPASAEDVAHDVVLKLMQGQLAGASPDRGRFRDYLKTILLNSARAWHRRSHREMAESEGWSQLAEEAEADAFDHCVRDEVMQAAWKSLEDIERQTQQPFASVLRWRTTVASTSSPELCALLRSVTGREYSEGNARKVLQRARDQYALLVVEQVRGLLPAANQTREDIEAELTALGLHGTCRSALNS